jgi:hypothetical protein
MTIYNMYRFKGRSGYIVRFPNPPDDHSTAPFKGFTIRAPVELEDKIEFEN